MHYAHRVFGVAFAACLLVQGWVWANRAALDHYWLWVDGVRLYATGNPATQPHLVHQYPATSILVPAAALVAAGMSYDGAFRITMAVLISLVSALTAATAFALRPKSLWWVFVAWLLVFQPLCMLATPPTALLAPLAALYALLILMARERATFSAAMLASIGICGGVMLATRLDMSCVFVGAGTVYLAWKRPAAFYVMPLCAVAVFLLCGAHFLSAPVEQVSHILERIRVHAQEGGNTIVASSIAYASPFGGAALALTGLLLATRRLRSLPADFAVLLMTVSLSITAVLLVSKHQPQWFFYPPFLVWELLLPLVVMDTLRALPEGSAWRVLARPGTSGAALASVYMLYQCWIFYFQLAE